MVYADCIYCGGEVQAITGTRDIRWKGSLYLIEGVPLGACSQCGERFVKPQVAKAIDRLLAEGIPSDTISVPVIRFVTDAA